MILNIDIQIHVLQVQVFPRPREASAKCPFKASTCLLKRFFLSSERSPALCNASKRLSFCVVVNDIVPVCSKVSRCNVCVDLGLKVFVKKFRSINLGKKQYALYGTYE